MICPHCDKHTPDPGPTRRDYRKELWIGVATAVAGAVNATDARVPGTWANAALSLYDATFKEKQCP